MQSSLQTRGDEHHQSEFSSDVSVMNHAQGRYSIVWLESVYYAGAAHSLSRFHVLNDDAQLKRPLQLSDLIKNTSNVYN